MPKLPPTVWEMMEAEWSGQKLIVPPLAPWARAPPIADPDMRLLAMLADGLRYPEICRELNIKMGTFKAQIYRLRKRLGITTIPSLIATAIREKWIE